MWRDEFGHGVDNENIKCHMKKIVSAVVFLISFSGVAFAAPASSPSFCPHLSQIKKNPDPAKQNWTAETKQGEWKSYDASFATKLVKLMGAQWNGENLGQVTCVYKAVQQFNLQGQLTTQRAIPVLIVYHSLVFQPTGGKWKHSGHGIYNCYSHHRRDCPFVINIKPPEGDPLQQAESFQSLEQESQPLQQPTN